MKKLLSILLSAAMLLTTTSYAISVDVDNPSTENISVPYNSEITNGILRTSPAASALATDGSGIHR